MSIENSYAQMIVIVVTLCGTAVGVAGDLSADAWRDLRDVDGSPIHLDDSSWKVVCFLGAECPLARLYGQRLSQLADDFADQGVLVVGINSNPQDSTDDVRQYIAEYEVSFPILKDSQQSWIRRLGATRTPEALIIDPLGAIRYQGRIDDQYEPGIARSEPTQHDLRDALVALLAGREPAKTRTEAVGCLVTILKSRPAPNPDATVTFTRDVAPILNAHCVECHRAGEIGPFELTAYDEVVGWGEMMLEVIEQGRMPPWHADPQFGDFAGARQMPAADRQVIADWVEQGMAEGDPSELPPLPEYAEGWSLAESPEAILAMRDRSFAVPAEGIVEYQYFVVDPHWQEDRWVRAAQVVPGSPAVVHHAIVFVRPPDGTDVAGIGWLGAYVPGQRAAVLPEGHARRIPANSKLVFQMHYTPNGRETLDTTKVGVWFSDAADVTHEVTTRVAINHHFEIPPGADDHSVKISEQSFHRNSRLLSASPHMHLRGKSFRLTARRGDQVETLLHVPQYDFNWQHWYQFNSPPVLDDIDALDMEVRFDNSDANPSNPDPDQFVMWGDQTWEEMAVAFFDVSHPRGEPRVLAAREQQQTAEEAAERKVRLAAEVDRFLEQMDLDGDGVIVRDEAPDAFRRFGFRMLDANDDSRLDRSEIEAAAARRL